MKKALYITLILAVLIGAYLFSIKQNKASANTASFVIENNLVDIGDVARIVSASGSVRALTTVEVGSQVSGQIIDLNADFNSEVSKGDIIARLDSQSFTTRVTSAEADVRSAKANIDVLKAQINRAQANLNLYEKDYTRQKELFDQKLIPRSTLEDTERQLTVGKSDLTVSQAQLRTGEAALAQRRAALATAQVDLDRTIIRSPIDGVVIERNVDVGQTVAASLSAPILFKIAKNLSEIRIDADVVEADIGGIDAGDTVVFTVDAYPNDEFTGTVEQVRLVAQELQNVVTYTVVIAAENSQDRLLPGMTTNLEITAEKRPNVLRVAESSLRYRPSDTGPEIIQAENMQNRSRGNRANPAERILNNLEIDASRKETISNALTEEFQAIRQSMSGTQSFDRNRIRQMFTNRTDKVLKKFLNSEEFKAYKKSQNTQSTTRRVELYQDNKNSTLSKKNVVIGLSDGSYTEIIRGAKEGDSFVARVIVNSDER